MSEKKRKRPVKKKVKHPRLRAALQLVLAAGALFAAGLLVVFYGPREMPAPPEPEPFALPEIDLRCTVQTQTPWNRLTDLRRVTLAAPDPRVQIWLEYPVFREEGEGFQRINAFFQALCRQFFSSENEDLLRRLEAAYSSGAQEFSCTNTARVAFSGVGVTVTLEGESAAETYVFRTDTGERLEPSEAEGEAFSGPPPVPELKYRTTVSEDPAAGARRVTLDPQGLDLSVFFEVPALRERSGGDRVINLFFQKLCDEFFSPDNGDLTRAWQLAAHPDAPNVPFVYERRVHVRTRTEKLVSVTLDYVWFLGGAENRGSDSYTFRADTGARLGLADVAEAGEGELKELILSALEEQGGGLGDGVLDRLRAYPLERFEFYVEDGGLFVSFDRYEATGEVLALRLPAAIKERFL